MGPAIAPILDRTAALESVADKQDHLFGTPAINRKQVAGPPCSKSLSFLSVQCIVIRVFPFCHKNSFGF